MYDISERLISVAPMMEYTDRHFRYLIRCISKHVFLFTEMITSAAIVNGDHKKLLTFNDIEHPIGIQIGGKCIKELLIACSIIQDYGYDEINLNVGCPSSAVQRGGFGAKLMLDKEHVGNIVSNLLNKSRIPISVKCRLGVDQFDTYRFLYDFIETVSSAGCKLFYIHARKAMLSGVSPKDNRIIPKLEYDKVYRLKRDFPNINFILNGGIQSLNNYSDIIGSLDGIMIGRAVYRNPLLLYPVDRWIYNSKLPNRTIQDIVHDYLEYAISERSTKQFHITKHMQGLWYGRPHAATFRRLVTSPDSKIDNIREFMMNAV
jgi:tRNA-dihydrouridine synthase A